MYRKYGEGKRIPGNIKKEIISFYKESTQFATMKKFDISRRALRKLAKEQGFIKVHRFPAESNQAAYATNLEKLSSKYGKEKIIKDFCDFGARHLAEKYNIPVSSAANLKAKIVSSSVSSKYEKVFKSSKNLRALIMKYGEDEVLSLLKKESVSNLSKIWNLPKSSISNLRQRLNIGSENRLFMINKSSRESFTNANKSFNENKKTMRNEIKAEFAILSQTLSSRSTFNIEEISSHQSDLNISGIYCVWIKCSDNEILFYIGQSKNILKRWRQHKKRIFSLIGKDFFKPNNAKSQNFLYSKIVTKICLDDLGLNDIKFTLLEKCESSELDEKEKYWINVTSAKALGLNRE